MPPHFEYDDYARPEPDFFSLEEFTEEEKTAFYNSITIHVPAEAVETYKNADIWKNFPNIVAETSGVKNTLATNAASVKCLGGIVTVDGLERGDVVSIYTTDGKLSTADAKVLTDDKGFFPSYQCGNVVRNQALQQHPKLRAELEKLQGTISEEDMSRMNYEVEEDGKDPKAVAEEFLSSKGLI